jgi:translation elongation factor EF-Ts
MTELTQRLLEQLVDCQESDIPPLRIIHLMASEIMRMRAYGDMIPAPDETLRQQAAVLLKQFHNEGDIGRAYKRVGQLLKEKFDSDSYELIEQLALFVAGESPVDDDSEWLEISLDMLRETEKVINDAVGFGRTGDANLHNTTLNMVRKIIEKSTNDSTTLVQKAFLTQMKQAVDEIVYGKSVGLDERQGLLVRLNAILPDAE